jgi:hypothetical protein
MLTTRIKRRADQSARALKRIAAFQAEVAARPDEDLLDFADIFVGVAGSTISQIATEVMNKRRISPKHGVTAERYAGMDQLSGVEP